MLSKQKTAYEMLSGDWSSDVCSSDLHETEVVNSMIMLFEQEESVKRYGRRKEKEGKIAAYADMVADGELTVERAAKKLNMTVDEFNEAVEALKVTA